MSRFNKPMVSFPSQPMVQRILFSPSNHYYEQIEKKVGNKRKINSYFLFIIFI